MTGTSNTSLIGHKSGVAPRPAPLLFGVLLIGLGGTAAFAAQSWFSLAQAASVWTLFCAIVLLGFFLSRARSRS